MMLFDGCFIVELIRKSAMKELTEDNGHLLTHFILRTVMRDLLLIENQLPFFILIKLFNMTKMPDEANQNFMHMAINCFSIMMPGPCNKPIENDPGIKHLLGLLHDSCVSPDYEGSSEEVRRLQVSKTSGGVHSRSSDAIRTNIQHSGIGAESEIFVEFEYSVGAIEDLRTAKSEGHEEKKGNWQTIGSASELDEAGIKFEKVRGRLFDINFEKGVMSIPTLKIVNDTESILRNLVAYEQCYKDISSRHFIDYIRFMDCLINTEKDVELLRHHEVIENRLGDNEVIADIFNRICDSVLISEEDFFYAELFVKVHKHCKRKWNLWKANLWHNYFNTPWALISFLAAVFLLLLTAMQSIYSAVGYHHPNANPPR